MRLLCTFFFLFCLSVLPLFAAAEPPSVENTKREILDMESRWCEAWLSGKPEAIEQLHANDYTGILYTGGVTTKENVAADVRAGLFRFRRLEHRDLTVKLNGITAVVTGLTINEGQRGELDVSGTFRYTRVYVLRDGRWQALHSQYTRVVERKP